MKAIVRRLHEQFAQPWRLLARVAIGVAGALLIFEIIYLIVVNTLLSSGMFARMLASAPKPHERLEVELGQSYSVLPGRVHLEGFRLRFEDTKVRLDIEIPRGTMDVRLRDLAKRRFHVTGLWGEGVHVRFLHKVEDLDAARRRVALFPRVPGFETPPVITEKKPPAPGASSRGPWTIHLERVNATVHEIWGMEYRWTGESRVAGGFFFVPKHELEIAPSRLELAKGELSLGGETPVGTALRGHLELRTERYDLRAESGAGDLQHFSGQVDLDLDLADLGVANLYLGNRTHASGGGGPLSVEVQLLKGIIEPGSSLRYTPRDAWQFAWHSRGFVAGKGEFRASVGSGGDNGIACALSGRGWSVGSDAAKAPPARVDALSANIWLEPAALHQPIQLERAEIQVKALRVSNLKLVEAWLDAANSGKGPSLAGGPLAVSLDAALDERGTVTGRVDVDGQDLRAAIDGMAISGDLRASGSATRDGGGSTILLHRVRVRLSETTVRVHDERIEPWWLAVSAPAFKLTTEPRLSISTELRIEAPNARPIVALLDLGTVPEKAAKILDLDDLEAILRIVHSGRATTIDVVEARTDSIQVKGRYVARAEDKWAAFLLDAPLLTVGVANHRREKKVKLGASTNWLEEQLARMPHGNGDPRNGRPGR